MCINNTFICYILLLIIYKTWVFWSESFNTCKVVSCLFCFWKHCMRCESSFMCTYVDNYSSHVLFGDAAAASTLQKYKANNYHHHLIDVAGFVKATESSIFSSSCFKFNPANSTARNFSGSGDSVFISLILRCGCF